MKRARVARSLEQISVTTHEETRIRMTNYLKPLWGMAVLLILYLAAPREAEAQPRAFFQWGTANGVENRLSISRVPVTDGRGGVKYYDVSLVFNVDNTGRLTLNTGASRITASPNVAVGAFRPGKYYGGRFNCDEFIVGAPGVVQGGRISGSIADDGCLLGDLSFNASWVAGPITGHPNEGALRAAGITYQGYSWGLVGEVGYDWDASGWNPGDLIGVVQSGQQLILHNFGDDNREDTSVVFTLCSSCS